VGRSMSGTNLTDSDQSIRSLAWGLDCEVSMMGDGVMGRDKTAY
jgi:hypothetical protein